MHVVVVLFLPVTTVKPVCRYTHTVTVSDGLNAAHSQRMDVVYQVSGLVCVCACVCVCVCVCVMLTSDSISILLRLSFVFKPMVYKHCLFF